MSGPIEKGFMGNNAFDDARAYVARRAGDLQEVRRAGAIAAAESAIAAAEADGGVQAVGTVDRRVNVRFDDHGDFRGLRVTGRTVEAKRSGIEGVLDKMGVAKPERLKLMLEPVVTVNEDESS